MASKSPMKTKDIEKMVKSTVSVDTTPEGKVVYSLAEKQSNTGMFNNQRFLMLNCRNGQLLYFDQIPNMSIPVTSLNNIPKPKPKNQISFKEVTYERPKEGTKNKLKFTLPPDEKGKHRSWLFIMNSKMVDSWIEELEHFKNYPLDHSPAVKSDLFGEKPIGGKIEPQPIKPSTQIGEMSKGTNSVAQLQQSPMNKTSGNYSPPKIEPPKNEIYKDYPLRDDAYRGPRNNDLFRQPQSNRTLPAPAYQPDNPIINKPKPYQNSNYKPQSLAFTETPLSQPRRGPFQQEPPESMRSNDMYMREQKPQFQYGQRSASPQQFPETASKYTPGLHRDSNPSKFPYRVTEDKPIAASSYNYQPTSGEASYSPQPQLFSQLQPNTNTFDRQQQRASNELIPSSYTRPAEAVQPIESRVPLYTAPRNSAAQHLSQQSYNANQSNFMPSVNSRLGQNNSIQNNSELQTQLKQSLNHALENEKQPKYFPANNQLRGPLANQDQHSRLTKQEYPSKGSVANNPRLSQPQSSYGQSYMEREPIPPSKSPTNFKTTQIRQVDDRPIFDVGQNHQYQQHHQHATAPFAKKPGHSQIKTRTLYSQQQHVNDIREPTKVAKSEPTMMDWNAVFNRLNVNQVEVIRAFGLKAEELTRKIINDMTAKNKVYQSVSRTNYSEIYLVENVSVKIAFCETLDTKQGIIKYNDQHVRALRNEFRNYSYLLNTTANRAQIRVPLTCITEYKGIVALIKADVDSKVNISVSQLSNELSKLERVTKINKSVFNFGAIFKQSSSTGLIYVVELQTLLPIDVWQGNHQFRPQAIHGSSSIVSGEPIKHSEATRMLDRTSQKTTSDLEQLHKGNKQAADRLVNSLEQLTTVVLNYKDIRQELHRASITTDYLSYLLEISTIPLLRQYFASEMAAKVAKIIFRCHLQTIIQDIKTQKTNIRDSEVDKHLLEEAYQFINDLCSYNTNNTRLWKLIFSEVLDRFKFTLSLDDIFIGYFLSSLFGKCNLKLNYEHFDQNRKFFRQTNTIEKRFVEGFKVRVCNYDYSFVGKFRKISEIVREEPTAEGLDTFVELLNLHEEKLPEDMTNYEDMCIYLANFIPPDFLQSKEFAHLDLYSGALTVPPNAYNVKVALMAAKWAIKMKKEQIAFDLFEKASETIAFWGGEYHPLLSEFFDFFTEVYLSTGQYDQAITLAKSSFVNTLKVVGATRLPVSEKYFQLANCYFKSGKKQDALTNYLKTKEVLAANKRNSTHEYGVVLLKLAVLELNFGRINQAIEFGLESLGLFERQPDNQREFVESLQLLSRAYEITQKSDRIKQLATLCSERIKRCDDPKLLQRMFKIVMYPQLSDLPQSSVKHLLYIVEELSAMRNPASYDKAFNYLYRRSQQENVSQVLLTYIDRLDRLMAEISQKDLLHKYKGFDSEARTQSQDLLVLFDAVLCIIDDSYVIGILRQYEY